MASSVTVDTSQIRSFFNRLEQAAGGEFKIAMVQFLSGLGDEFLRILQDEIIRHKVMDTRLLLSSFQKGSTENVWLIDEDGLTLEVGTNVAYAEYVNDGHWTCKKGEEKRFVPGYWSGDRFVYDPSAKSGMVLKQKWIEGAHYWEWAIRILERIYPALLEAKLQEWMDTYFKEFI